ncbi:hypothetical protein [Nocardia sp. NPDC051832]|uniref:DUF6891 domain-containing protein n=1 Tax=Nocardia sp. NPDC051832 TaxID=3155673 RepID=UPI003449BCB3
MEFTDEDLERFVRGLIVPGFRTLPEVLETVEEWAGDEGVPVVWARAVAYETWQERLAEQREWSTPGDYDRLVRAFAELESQGFLARMNFACCTKCATTEIAAERTADPNPKDWYHYREWAYVFFHEQDTDRLGGDHPQLFLGYSAFRALPDTPDTLLAAAKAGDETATRAIFARTEQEAGRRVTNTLARHGLDALWSGDPADRISLRIRDWRKPLPE